MKRWKNLVAGVLTASMLLSGLGGAVSAEDTPVVLDRREVFEALSETRSIVYEGHEEGYAVTLDRTAGGASMAVTSVPEADRAAWKARLYVDTGAELQRGAVYRVSFTLSAEREQRAYDVHFDSTAAEDAYGAVYGRSVAENGADLFEYQFTAEAAKGPLVLRLQLGDTGEQGNLFRFTDLKVEEVSAAAGDGSVLADGLNYGTQGDVSYWCSEDSGAILTGGADSATLTVTETPRNGAEVWKIKLLAATGLIPEAGKAYHVRAELNSTAEREYELCFNEGEAEKGYDVLYGQKLTAGTQSVDRIIYVPSDRENPGELVLQFSLGNLAAGEAVTLSGVAVEEAVPAYTSVLPEDFAFDKSETKEFRSYGTVESGAQEVALAFDWASEESITVTGDKAGALEVAPTSASLTVNGGDKPWHARLNIHTGAALVADKVYRVTLTVRADNAYSNYELLYGNGFKSNSTVDNNEAYGALKGRVLAADTPDTVEYLLDTTGSGAGQLLISLFVGAGGDNKVTVSDLKIEDMSEVSDYSAKVLSSFNFNSGNVWSVINAGDGLDVEFSKGDAGTSSRVQMTVTSPAPYNDRAAIVLQPCYDQLTPGKSYRVKLDVWADKDVAGSNDLAIRYGTAGTNNSTKTAYHDDFGKTLTAGTPQTFTETFVPASGNENLLITLECGKLDAGTTLTVSNLRVEELPAAAGTPTVFASYPTNADPNGSPGGSFEVATDTIQGQTYNGGVKGDGSSVTMVCWQNPDQTTSSNNAYCRRLFIKVVRTLAAGCFYQISFDIKFDLKDRGTFTYNIANNKDDAWGTEHEEKYGKLENLVTPTDSSKIEYVIKADSTGSLWLRFDIGMATDDVKMTISNIQVTELTALAADDEAWSGDVVVHQKFSADAVKCDVNDSNYTATLTTTAGNASTGSAQVDVTDVPDSVGAHDEWKLKLYIKTGFTPEPNKSYRVSFDIAGTAAQDNVFLVFYGYGGANTEKIYGAKYEQSVSATAATISQLVSKNGGDQPLEVQIQLGNVNAVNTFTISNLKIEEVSYSTVQTGGRTETTYAVNADTQEGYKASLEREKDSASMALTEVPEEGAEPWKAKLFIDTGVKPEAGETYRVTLSVKAEKDQSFEICYNRDGEEKGYDAVYGQFVSAGETRTLEKVFTAEGEGTLIVQVSLGSALEPNTVEASGLKVERVDYTDSGESALPAPLSYLTRTAVDYWAHEDYTAALTGSADAATLDLTAVPAEGAEPWKVKLFVHTGALLHPGRSYKVTAQVRSTADQDIELCYNNGGEERGYDGLGGIHLTAGQTQTIEKQILVSPSKENTQGLSLQFNLGGAAEANSFTVSGVKVEELPLALRDALPAPLSYAPGGSVRQSVRYDYAASLSGGEDSATIHFTRVPANGETWMAMLYVSTGARLAAGKTYLVTADLLSAQSQSFELCYNEGRTEKGYDVLYGQWAEGGQKRSIERLITVPADKANPGELILQFSLGASPADNDVTVSGVKVQELASAPLESGTFAFDFARTVVKVSENGESGSGFLRVDRPGLRYELTKLSGRSEENEIALLGASLCAGEGWELSFKARADKALTAEFALCTPDGENVVLQKTIALSETEQTYSFASEAPLTEGALYALRWRFGSGENQALGSAAVELSDVHVWVPSQSIAVARSGHHVTVDGEEVHPDMYNIGGNNYFKLRDVAMLLKDTESRFGVQYLAERKAVSVATGAAYEPIGGELAPAGDAPAEFTRSTQSLEIDGEEVFLVAYNIGGYNCFKLRDLGVALGFGVDFDAESQTVRITSREA